VGNTVDTGSYREDPMADPATPDDRPRPPSPPWYGGLGTALLGVMVVILLTYTLLDWDWQQRLGAWNYVAVGVLVVVTSALMKNWRADLSRHDSPAGERAAHETQLADPADLHDGPRP
jgi:hypothetical protein